MLREQKERFKVALTALALLVLIFAVIYGGYHLATGKSMITDNIPVIISGQEYKGEVKWSHGDFSGTGTSVVDSNTEVFIFNSEEGNTVITCAVAGMTFGDNIGRILWKKGVMTFEGNADESAKIFFEEFLKPYIDDYIKSELEKEELIELILEEPEDIMYQFATSFDYITYQPVWFLKVVNTDMSKCFIDGRLRLDLNGEIYWIRLEED